MEIVGGYKHIMETIKIQKGIAVFARFNDDLSKPIYYMDVNGQQVLQSNKKSFILPIFQIALRMDKFVGVQQALQHQYQKIQNSVLSCIQKKQGYVFLKVVQEENTINFQNYQKMKYVDLNFIYYPQGQKIQLMMNKSIQELTKDE